MSFTEYNCLLFQENPSSQSWMMCTYLSLALTPKRNIGLLSNLYIDIPCVNNFPQSLPTSKFNFLHFSAFWKLVIIEIFLQFRWHFYQLLPLWCLLQPILERLSLSCHLLPLNCLIHSLCLCLCIYLCLCFCQCLCLDVFGVFDVYSSWSWNILIYWYGHLLPLNCLVQSFYLCLCLSGRLCIWCLWCLPQSWNIFIFLGIFGHRAPSSILGREKNINCG